MIVDAENVRRSLWPNLGREELVERARAWAAREGHDLLVVFDGAPPGPDAPDLLGARHADDAIVEAAAAAGAPVWVATSDRALRERLAGTAERLVGGGSFARLLQTGADDL